MQRDATVAGDPGDLPHRRIEQWEESSAEAIARTRATLADVAAKAAAPIGAIVPGDYLVLAKGTQGSVARAEFHINAPGT